MRNNKKDRSKNKPSELVLELLRVVNLIPMSITIPSQQDLKELFASRINKSLNEVDFGNDDIKKKYLWEFLQDTILEICEPYPLLKEFVTEHQHGLYRLVYKGVTDISDDYFHFLSLRLDLKVLVGAVPKLLKKYENGVFLSAPDLTGSDNYRLWGFISKDFYFDFQPSFLACALQDVSALRLKICPICETIFWAYRLNQKFCTDKCSNAYHQRRYLSDEDKRKKYNIKRQETYQNIKAREENRKELLNNGTL